MVTSRPSTCGFAQIALRPVPPVPPCAAALVCILFATRVVCPEAGASKPTHRATARHAVPLTEMATDRITVDPNKMGGVPIIRNLRMPVATVVAMVADGMTVDEIITEFPILEPEDVEAALRFAAEAVRERAIPLTPAT